MNDLEKVMKAFANRRRLAIVKHLKQNREVSVGDIAGVIHLSIRSTSKHLNVLASASILEKEQRSSTVYYRLLKEPKFYARQIIQLI